MWAEHESSQEQRAILRAWIINSASRKRSESCSVVSNSLRPHELYSPWNSPGQNTGVGSLSLLQGIFQTQGLNPALPHCRWILYQLSHKGSPRILEWAAFLFSRGSSWPRNRTRVSCIAGIFFTNWAIREAQRKARQLGRREVGSSSVGCFWSMYQEGRNIPPIS